MKYCKKCLMPDTRPGISFMKDGVCAPCHNYEKQKHTDWDARKKELEKLCDKYRGCNGPNKYDCAIAVSGGKDSTFQVYGNERNYAHESGSSFYCMYRMD